MMTKLLHKLRGKPMSRALKATLSRAADLAAAHAHAEVSTEHMLLALTDDPDARADLELRGVDCARLTRDLLCFLGDSDLPLMLRTKGIAISVNLRRILEAATASARRGAQRGWGEDINGAIVIAAIIHEGSSAAAGLLIEQLTIISTKRAEGQMIQVGPASMTPAHGPQPELLPNYSEDISKTIMRPRPRPQTASRRVPEEPRYIGADRTDLPLPDSLDVFAVNPASSLPEPWDSAGLDSADPTATRSSSHQQAGLSDVFPPKSDQQPPVAATGTEDQVSVRPSAGVSLGTLRGNRTQVESGQLVENIPRHMQTRVPVVVEARIARADFKLLEEGMHGNGTPFRHEVFITRAMSVQLRAPAGSFWIESCSPETQWVENVLGLPSEDYASWRWTVTPRERGHRQLQFVVSARMVGADGLAAERALPDQMINVDVGINVWHTVRLLASWTSVAVAGALVGRFGNDAFEFAKALLVKVITG